MARSLTPAVIRLCRYLGAAIGIAALILTALFLIPFYPVMPQDGLDPSWGYALNEAVAESRVFGRDVIFTYGPLSSIYTAFYDPGTDTLMMIGSVVYALGFSAAFALLAHPRRYAFLALLPAVVPFLIVQDSKFLVLPFVLLLVVIRVSLPPGARFRLKPSPLVVLGIALVTSAVAMEPLIKGSFFGVVGPVCGLIALLLTLWDWRAGLGFAGLALATLVAAWVAAGQPPAALLHFFIAQGPIISGYTNAMALDGPVSATLAYLAAALVLSTIFYLRFTRATGWFGWAALLALAWTLFIVFKAGFVRQDGHMVIAGSAILLLGCVLCLLSSLRVTPAILAVSAATSVYLIYTIAPTEAFFPRWRLWAAWEQMTIGLSVRLTDPGRLDDAFAAANAAIRTQAPLPSAKGTVDLYPADLSAIFASGLRWAGRPVFQSYSAYEPSLDEKNAAFLRSASAPDTVFLTISPIDGRMPTLDDAGSFLPLLRGYDIVGYPRPYLQMAKRAAPADVFLDEAKSRVIAARLGSDIILDSTGPVWATLNLRPTLLGRIVTAVYKLPPLRIVLKLEDGRTVEHRYIASIGNAGFILSPDLERVGSFLRLAAGLGVPRVTAFRITTSGRNLWSPQFEVRLTPIHLTPQPTARALLLIRSGPPPTALTTVLASPKPECHLDTVNGGVPGGVLRADDGTLQLQGWTNPPAAAPGGPEETWVTLTSLATGETRFFRAGTDPRPDVAAWLKLPGMREPGFDATLDLGAMPGPQMLNIYSLSGGKAHDCGLALRVE